MIAARTTAIAALTCALAAALSAHADTTSYEDVDGLRYQVTRRTMQVPVTQTTPQTQTVYRQQMTTQTVQHQQLYTVPVTQYQLVSQLHGRWNPFMTPYWTHNYQPVTTWQQQTATVQIPVNTVAWAPETRTVQTPTTTYRTVENAVVSRILIGAAPGAVGGSQQMMAANSGATNYGTSATSGPTATLAARPSTTTYSSVPTVAAAPTYSGQAMTSDPPRTGAAFQPTSPDSRYR